MYRCRGPERAEGPLIGLAYRAWHRCAIGDPLWGSIRPVGISVLVVRTHAVCLAIHAEKGSDDRGRGELTLLFQHLDELLVCRCTRRSVVHGKLGKEGKKLRRRHSVQLIHCSGVRLFLVRLHLFWRGLRCGRAHRWRFGIPRLGPGSPDLVGASRRHSPALASLQTWTEQT